MKRWKWSVSWVSAWKVLFLAGGIILYLGYHSLLTGSAQEGTQKKMAGAPQVAQVLLAQIKQTDDVKGDLIAPNSLTSGFADAKKDQAIQDGLKLVFGQSSSSVQLLRPQDFPSPVHGNILRNVGNYYSEALDNYLFHAGVDYAEPEGTVIRATHGGKVTFAGSDAILGQKVTLDCGEGWQVTYGGLENIRVHEGETVENQGTLGQVGFQSGAEGRNGQTQFHYEVWHGDEVQKPL